MASFEPPTTVQVGSRIQINGVLPPRPSSALSFKAVADMTNMVRSLWSGEKRDEVNLDKDPQQLGSDLKNDDEWYDLSRKLATDLQNHRDLLQRFNDSIYPYLITYTHITDPVECDYPVTINKNMIALRDQLMASDLEATMNHGLQMFCNSQALTCIALDETELLDFHKMLRDNHKYDEDSDQYQSWKLTALFQAQRVRDLFKLGNPFGRIVHTPFTITMDNRSVFADDEIAITRDKVVLNVFQEKLNLLVRRIDDVELRGARMDGPFAVTMAYEFLAVARLVPTLIFARQALITALLARVDDPAQTKQYISTPKSAEDMV